MVQGTQNYATSAGGSRFLIGLVLICIALIGALVEQINGVDLAVINKNKIRVEMRERRRSLPFEERAISTKALAKNLRHLLGVRRVGRIAGYIANDGEIDPIPALLECLERGNQCFLPVLLPGQRPYIRFANYSNNSRLCLNKYGILEPLVAQSYCLNGSQLDWILLPLVAFDVKGNRLGMGGGYYDASLVLNRHRQHWQSPRLIGLAYEFQRIDKLLADEWDVPMHGILTDKRFYAARNQVTLRE